MTELNKTMPPLPRRIARLPVDERGYPVPWFVHWEKGKPDFRVVDGIKIQQALQHKLCWVCGTGLGSHLAFPIGPMCSVNRVSAEPPSHRDCAEFSAKACPFLLMPTKCRREGGLPKDAEEGAGEMIRRNPGVILVWITKSFKPERDPLKGGFIFRVGPPEELVWLREGRTATRAEVLESFRTGLPVLREAAEQDGAEAVKELGRMYDTALKLIPKE